MQKKKKSFLSFISRRLRRNHRITSPINANHAGAGIRRKALVSLCLPCGVLKINPLIIQDLKNDYEDEDGECTCGAVNSDKSLVNVAEPRLKVNDNDNEDENEDENCLEFRV